MRAQDSGIGIGIAVVLTVLLGRMLVMPVVTAEGHGIALVSTVLLAIVLCVALIHTVPRSRSIAGAVTAALGIGAATVVEVLDLDHSRQHVTALAQLAVVGGIVLGGSLGRDIARGLDDTDWIIPSPRSERKLRVWRWGRGFLAGIGAGLVLGLMGSMTAGFGQHGMLLTVMTAMGVAAGAAMGVHGVALASAAIVLVLFAFAQQLGAEEPSALASLYATGEEDDGTGLTRALQLTAVLAVAAVPIMADRHREWDAAGHHRF